MIVRNEMTCTTWFDGVPVTDEEMDKMDRVQPTRSQVAIRDDVAAEIFATLNASIKRSRVADLSTVRVERPVETVGPLGGLSSRVAVWIEGSDGTLHATGSDMSESMQWVEDPTETDGFIASINAETLVDWVNANGGEARYQPAYARMVDPDREMDEPARIAVRTRDGWAYCAPGQRIVMGEHYVVERHPDGSVRTFAEFTVEDA